ncbi:MAG: hypothetical protein AAGC71_00610 [Pseudomonadota bacterium]
MSTISATVRRVASDVNTLHSEYLDDDGLAEAFRRFLDWQSQYLLAQHAEFAERAEYRDATAFVVNDLTGYEVNKRDHDLARIIPLMSRVLPDSVLATLASALELNANALKINLTICRYLVASGEIDALTERNYAAAVRAVTDRDSALTMVLAIKDLGLELDRIVHTPMIGSTLASMALPARLMGFRALHHFLAEGYRVFRALPDTQGFLDELEAQMLIVYARLYDSPLESLDTAGTSASTTSLDGS